MIALGHSHLASARALYCGRKGGSLGCATVWREANLEVRRYRVVVELLMSYNSLRFGVVADRNGRDKMYRYV